VPLFKELFAVCSNGCLPNLTFVQALLKCHAAAAIYHHQEDVGSWAPRVGGKLRMVAAKYRSLAEDEDKLSICLKKALPLHI